MLSAQGGHPGGDSKHVAVRRWRARRAGFASIAAILEHPAEGGDGVRGRVVSSRSGELGAWSIHHGQVETKLERVEVHEGDTLDFVVDCLTNEAHDAFGWSPAVELTATDGETTLRYNAAIDFRGPAPAARRLSSLEQYAPGCLLAGQ